MKIARYWPVLFSLIVLVIPVSPNYDLRELNVGNGGGGVGNSTNYSAEQTFGELGGGENGTNYNGGIGFGFTQMANVPPAPTFTNPANYYNKLHVVLATGNNPSDTVFALAISTDNFATTQYVKSDDTVGPALAIGDYQTYAVWGGASGFDVIGLQPNTTYQIKAKAKQGNFTESGYGPAASASTVNPTLSFDIDVSATDSETSPPYNLDIGSLTPGSVTTASNKIWVDLDTNAASGGNVYVYSSGSGLSSVAKSFTIPGISGDLGAASQGFGLQDSSVAQTSGGPLGKASPFDGTSNTVGNVTTSVQQIFSSTAPITAGRASTLVMAKSSSLTPAASDYSTTLTMIAAANF